MTQLSQLYVYPLKSAAGISLDAASLTRRGLEHDRRWMVVDAANDLVTQRERPELALIRPSLAGACLYLQAPGLARLELPLSPTGGERVTVQMWSEPMAAWVVKEATPWVSAFLGGDYRLVYMPESTLRIHAHLPEQPLSFVDGNPLHLLSEASLADLNGRSEIPVSIARFRPNLVVTGCAAFAEDTWQRLQIGPVTLRRIEPCARCVVVNIDQETAEPYKEPLKTLARYRRVSVEAGGKTHSEVHFGQHFRASAEGTLRCGDPVEVLRAGISGAA